MKLFTGEISIDEMHLMIYEWLEAIPHSQEINSILLKIKILIRKHSFSTLLEPDPKIPGYKANRNLPVAATFMLLLYLTDRCWDLFGKKKFEEELFPQYTGEYLRMEKFVRGLDLSTVMSSMFDLIKQTVGEEFFNSFRQTWEEENKNWSEKKEGVIRNYSERQIINFMSLRGFVDACFFIFNDLKTGAPLPVDR